MNEVSAAGRHGRDSKIHRVHRVFHRIGVVFGVPAAIVGIVFFAIAGSYALSGVTEATKVSDVISGIYPVRQQGEQVIYPDGSSESVRTYLAMENNVRRTRHEVNVNKNVSRGLIIFVAALLFYASCRAVGWIIAGAFKE